MKAFDGKFRSKKGFTLVEMLIVVAIIAILIAVSIPLVSNSLEKSRDATDQANERAAKAEAVLLYLGVTDLTYNNSDFYAYNAETGKLQIGTDGITPYGKCTKQHEGEHLFASEIHSDPDDPKVEDEGDHVNKYLTVAINDDGSVQLYWT